MAQMLTINTRKEGKGKSGQTYWPQCGTLWYSGDDELPEGFRLSGYLHNAPDVGIFIFIADGKKKRKDEEDPEW